MEDKKVEILDEEETEIRFKKSRRKRANITASLGALFFFIALIIYILMGSIWGYWDWGWIVFLLGVVLASLIDAIYTKRVSHFNYPFLALSIYIYLGMVTPKIWHPTWILFLGIPVFYIISGMIDKMLHKK